MKILVTPATFIRNTESEAKKLLEAFADDVIYSARARPLTEDEVTPLLDGVDGYIAGLDQISSRVIGKMPATLKVISRYGVGYDNIDIPAATNKGIIVTNTPGVNAHSVAELAFGLLLSVARNIPVLDHGLKSLEWRSSSGLELYGKTFGILGLGAIGKIVASIAKGFSMRVIAYDPFIDKADAAKSGIHIGTFEEVMRESDILSLHLPLSASTRHIIGVHAISMMKQGAIVINTARGGLIDLDAVYEALASGRLGGLGLDAYDREPPGDLPLFKLENVVATPHIASHTAEAVEGMAVLSVQNLIAVLTGKDCDHIVNMGIQRGTI